MRMEWMGEWGHGGYKWRRRGHGITAIGRAWWLGRRSDSDQRTL